MKKDYFMNFDRFVRTDETFLKAFKQYGLWRMILFFDDLNEALTDSSPALSAFQAMTGIPKNPAICKKYCEAAVDRPNFSVLVK